MDPILPAVQSGQERNGLFSKKISQEKIREIKFNAFLELKKLADELIENSIYRLTDLDNNFPVGVERINIAKLAYYCIAAVKGNIKSLQKIYDDLPGKSQINDKGDNPFNSAIQLCDNYTVELDKRSVNNAINLVRNNIVFEELKSNVMIIKQRFLSKYSGLDENFIESRSCCVIL